MTPRGRSPAGAPDGAGRFENTGATSTRLCGSQRLLCSHSARKSAVTIAAEDRLITSSSSARCVAAHTLPRAPPMFHGYTSSCSTEITGIPVRRSTLVTGCTNTGRPR